jgi:hypothetical protein
MGLSMFTCCADRNFARKYKFTSILTFLCAGTTLIVLFTLFNAECGRKKLDRAEVRVYHSEPDMSGNKYSAVKLNNRNSISFITYFSKQIMRKYYYLLKYDL